MDQDHEVIDHNTPMRETPDGIPEIIAPFVRDRRDAFWVANASSGVRNRVGCTHNCPHGHFCYPAGEGCTPLGEKRPGQDHCCQSSILQDMQFLTTVDRMKNTAVRHPGNRGPASDRYRHHFFDLVRVLTQGVQLTGPRFYWMDIDTSDGSYERFPVLNLKMQGAMQYGNLSDETRVKLIKLGFNLFQRMAITIRDDSRFLLEVDSLIREDPGMFFMIRCIRSCVIPIDIISVARNIRVECPGGFLGNALPTERQLFSSIRSALLNSKNPVNAVLDLRYSGEGTEEFTPIVDACHGSEFHGRIIVHILPDTAVEEGTFNGISIRISSDGYPGEDDEPYGFSIVYGRALIIERVKM